MDRGRHERIRKLYEDLSDIGVEAQKRASALPEPGAQGGLGLRSAAPIPNVTVRPATTSGGVVAGPVALTNPFSVVATALATIATSPLELFGIGAIFVFVLGIISGALIGWNTTAGAIDLTRSAPRLILLPFVAYIFGRWIRIGRSRGGRPFTLKFFAGDIAIVVGSALIVMLLASRIIESNAPLEIRYAAFFTKYWPLHGPYPSMIGGAPGLFYLNMPRGTTFLEPFAYTLAMLPTVFFVPLILKEYRGFGIWFGSLTKVPLTILALIVATLPFAILNLNLSDWSRRMITAGDRNSCAFVLATICYAQIAVIGATLGECYRRISGRNP